MKLIKSFKSFESIDVDPKRFERKSKIKPEIKRCIGKCNRQLVPDKEGNPSIYCPSCDRWIK